MTKLFAIFPALLEQFIYDFLGPANCKGRDYDITAPFLCCFYYLNELIYFVFSPDMVPVSLSGFDKYIICTFDYVRIPKYGHIPDSKIPGENKLGLPAVFSHPQLHY